MHTQIEEITIGVQNEGLPQFVFVFLQRENKHDNKNQAFYVKIGSKPLNPCVLVMVHLCVVDIYKCNATHTQILRTSFTFNEQKTLNPKNSWTWPMKYPKETLPNDLKQLS